MGCRRWLMAGPGGCSLFLATRPKSLSPDARAFEDARQIPIRKTRGYRRVQSTILYELILPLSSHTLKYIPHTPHLLLLHRVYVRMTHEVFPRTLQCEYLFHLTVVSNLVNQDGVVDKPFIYGLKWLVYFGYDP